jgi:hypothetical protein
MALQFTVRVAAAHKSARKGPAEQKNDQHNTSRQTVPTMFIIAPAVASTMITLTTVATHSGSGHIWFHDVGFLVVDNMPSSLTGQPEDTAGGSVRVGVIINQASAKLFITLTRCSVKYVTQLTAHMSSVHKLNIVASTTSPLSVALSIINWMFPIFILIA